MLNQNQVSYIYSNTYIGSTYLYYIVYYGTNLCNIK